MHLLWDSSRKSPEHSVERKATLSIWIRSFTSWPDASGRGENLIYRTGRSEIWAKFCISLIQWSLGNGLLCVCVRVLQATLESPTSFLALKKSLSIYQSEHRASRISSKWDDRVCVCVCLTWLNVRANSRTTGRRPALIPPWLSWEVYCAPPTINVNDFQQIRGEAVSLNA